MSRRQEVMEAWNKGVDLDKLHYYSYYGDEDFFCDG